MSYSPQERGAIPATPHSLAAHHFTARDLRTLLLWVLAAAVGITVAYRYFFRAFPEAAVNFQVSRAAALNLARDFVSSRGGSLKGYKSAIVFDIDDQQKTYLEREVGLAQANQLMSSDVSVWYWDVRFFRPLQKHEYRVRISPAGHVVGFENVIGDADPGAHLDRAEALDLAQTFLTDTLHYDLAAYTFLPEEANSTSRPNRTDWNFTWERTGFRAKEAPYRLHVTIQGDTVGTYGEFLKVPEDWQRSYARLRSSNNFIETIALIPYALLLGAALSIMTILGRRGLLSWSWALKLGLFISALYFVMNLNQIPLLRAGYDTNDSYVSFFALEIAKALGTSLLLSLLVVIAALPGEPLYRIGQPEHLRLRSAFTFRGLRTKQFFSSGVIGLCLAAAHIGFVVVFYIVGQRFGVWAPQDLQYSDTLSTVLPWIYPLTIGIYAATSEEFLFRLFSVRFMLRSTRSRILAVVLPAFAWGFLHSNYPQEPPYIRGLEVGLIGVVAGLVMLRWGILATLTWHYTVDAFLGSLSLMRSTDLYSRISGGIVGFAAVIPVLIAGIMYVAHRGFAGDTELLNGAEPMHESPEPAAEPHFVPEPDVRAYRPLAPRVIGGILVAAAISVAFLLAVKPQRIGDFVKFSMTPAQAEARSADVLRGLGVDPSIYHRVATTRITLDDVVNEYLRRTVGIEAANRIYRDEVPSAFWGVRFFRDSQPEEYLVVLFPDGRPYSVHHTLAEAAPGPNLGKDDALMRATDFLRDTKKMDLSQWVLVDSQSVKLPARTDHSFTWEQPKTLDAVQAGAEGAHIRIQLLVQGAEVSGFRTFIHLPEEWLRQHTQSTVANTIQELGLEALIGAFVVAVLVIFFKNLKAPAIAAVPWRRMAEWGLVVLAAAIVRFLTLAPQYLLTYRTDTPFTIFVASTFIGLILFAALIYSAAVLLLGVGWYFLASDHRDEMPSLRAPMPSAYYRDGILIGICGAAILAGVHRLGDLIAKAWPVLRYAIPANVPKIPDATWPALNVISGALLYSVIGVGMLAVILGFAFRYFRKPWMVPALLVALALVLSPRWGSAGELIQDSFVIFLELAVVWWGAVRIARFNLVGYVLWGILLVLLPAAQDLISQPNSLFRLNGVIVLAAIVALLIWVLFSWRRATHRDARLPDTVASA